MRARLIWIAVVAAALFFAVQGGEYSTIDIVRQRRALAALASKHDSLARVVDSLRAQERLVRTDPATQERIAREDFGMVHGPDVLYRFIPDSTPHGH